MFEFSSIADYHLRLKEGSTTCTEAVSHYLQQCRDKQHLNAFVDLYAEEAIQRASELDIRRKQGAKTGRLHGVIIAIKDVIAYEGHRLSAASRILKDFVSVYSSTAVERLLNEEAIIIGNCNCDEFAMGSTNENSSYGAVLNALDEDRVPGGSSGGSAVAVQAGLCMVSLGSDTGGSVRQPADFCGIIGFKPGYGRISRHGLIAYASSFDQIGIFGIQVPDVALVYEVIAGADSYDSTVSLRPIDSYTKFELPEKSRVAWFPAAMDHPSIDPAIANSITGLLEQLKDRGHTVESQAFEFLDFIVPAYYVLTTAEASANLSRYDGVRYGHRTPSKVDDIANFYQKSRSEGFGTEVKRRIMLGSFVLSAGYYDAYFTRAQKVRKLIKEKIELIFNEFDFIFLPTSPSTAFRFGEKSDPINMYLSDIYTVMANLAGIPSISIPLFWHNNGLPYGLQVMSARFNEVYLQHFSNRLLQEFRQAKK